MSKFEVSIKNLTASAGKKNILKIVELEHGYKSLAALMGPMGGGKSTFLKFLVGNANKEGVSLGRFESGQYITTSFTSCNTVPCQSQSKKRP